jgi:hypothetical protein
VSLPRSIYRRLLPAAATLASIACAFSATAQAQSYGEIGKPFVPGSKLRLSSSDRAFGVDPSNNDVYVGDEPKENEYRIQRFSPTGTLLNSVSMKVKREATEGLEGIAIDPALKRVYALIVYEREGKEGNPKFSDPEYLAAGTLLAFTPELTPAAGTKEENGISGVLANKTTLDAQSETTATPTSSALLEPTGITVDPTTHDVVILGKEEQCDKAGEECEERLLTAAQRVSSAGVLGKRWVDAGECFEGEGEGSPASCPLEGELVLQPGSPVGLAATGNGRILVDVPGSHIWEIPQSFESGLVSADAPHPVAVESGGVAELANPLQELIRFPGALSPVGGGSLAYIQESGESSSEGRVYQAIEVEGVAGGFDNPGALMLKLSSSGALSEVGWTGGQNKAEQQPPSGGCAISAFSAPLIAPGSGQTVFVLDPNKLPKQQEAPTPQVTTFGPGGSHCPTASATVPIATVDGTQVGTSTSPAEIGQQLKLSSRVTQANALSVTWSFGDGSSETVEQPQFRTTAVEHAFSTAGEKTVTETIATDNLAQPTITVSATVVVSPGEEAGGLPEYRVCVKAPKSGKQFTGEFTDKLCSTKSPTQTGEYELASWQAAKKLAFTGKAGSSTLEVYTPESTSEPWRGGVGKATVQCKSGKVAGEITGAKTSTLTIAFKGCSLEGEKCASAGAKPGEVDSEPLQETLGSSSAGVSSEIEPAGGGVANFSCGGTSVIVSGSLIGVDSGDVNAISKTSALTFAVNAHGGQEVVFGEFAGISHLGAAHYLTSTLGASDEHLPASLTTTMQLNGEALEIEAPNPPPPSSPAPTT